MLGLLGPYRAALASVAHNRNLRLAQLSSFAAWSGEFLFITVATVFAYDHDGVAGAALMGFLRVLPSALALPLFGALADRVSRRSLLVGSTAVRALSAGAAAVAAAADQTVLGYALVTLSTVSHSAYRPTLGALMPSLCTSPEELTSTNAIRSILDGLAALVGPLTAAALLAAFSPAVAFAAVAVLAAVSLLFAAALRYESQSNATVDAAAEQGGVLAEMWDGLRELRRSPRGAVVIVLGTVQCLVRGALTVLAVIVAVELVGMGKPGVGVLWAAFGVGGFVAATASIGAAGSRRLGTLFGVGVAMWGVPVIVCGLVLHSYIAVAAFLIIGAANALVDVSGFTLLQRLVPDRMLARILALAEAAFALAIAVGSLAISPVVSLLGNTSALIVTGCLPPIVVVASYTLLRGIDADIEVRTDRITLLRRVGMLRLLPIPAIESLAVNLVHTHVSAGTDVFRKGDPGDGFYVIESGRLAVLDNERPLRQLGPGDSFGEIALLQSVPRTLTVRAVEDADLAVISGTRFVSAVGGFSAAASGAQEVVSRYLADDLRRRAAP